MDTKNKHWCDLNREMKDIVVIKIPGYPSEEELVKLGENLKEVFEGTNQKPLIIFGDTTYYMINNKVLNDKV